MESNRNKKERERQRQKQRESTREKGRKVGGLGASYTWLPCIQNHWSRLKRKEMYAKTKTKKFAVTC